MPDKPLHPDYMNQSTPRADLSVNSMGYLIIKVKLPAMNKEDLELTVEGQRLTVASQRPGAGPVREKTRHLAAKFNAVHLVVEAPAEFDLSRARPVYQKNLLRIVVPRRDDGTNPGTAAPKPDEIPKRTTSLAP